MSTMNQEINDRLKDGESKENAVHEVVKRRLRVQFDIAYGGSSGKIMDDEENTVPDMHMTIQQLLENHTRDADGNLGMQQPVYLETEIPTISDITDVEAFKESLERRLADVKEFIENEAREKKEAEEKAQKELEDENRKNNEAEKARIIQEIKDNLSYPRKD